MKLKEILRDRDSGAMELLKRAVSWMIEHPECLQGAEQEETLEILLSERPSMSAFARLAERVKRDPSPAMLARVREELRISDSAIARNMVDEMSSIAPAGVITLSWSSTVVFAIRYCTHCFHEVNVLESLPGGEGKRLANTVGGFHARVKLHADNKLAEAAEQSSLGIIGADTVFSDGAVINKLLSATIGETLKRQNKPLYVLASRWKFNTQKSGTFSMDPKDRKSFEIVPAELISGIITEDGIQNPSSIDL